MLDDNLSDIRERAPSIATILAEATSMPSERLSAGADTLVLDGRQLTSSYDRRFESGFQAEEAPADATSVTVYGWGLGDVQRALLEREGLERLQVVLLHPGSARAVLEHFDQRDWIADPRVELISSADVTAVNRPLAMAAGSLSLAAEDENRVALEVVKVLAHPAPVPDDLLAALEASATAFIRGLNRLGSEMLIHFTDFLVEALETQQAEETVRGFMTLLDAMITAQKNRNYLYICDLLLYEFRPAIT